MEVDIPQQVNSYKYSPPTNGHHVHFDTEIKVVKLAATSTAPQQRPKHKSRRRARVPNLELEDDEMSGVSSTGKPPSPSKLKKMADKDRHSRSGRRGNPKKGEGCWCKDTIVFWLAAVISDHRWLCFVWVL